MSILDISFLLIILGPAQPGPVSFYPCKNQTRPGPRAARPVQTSNGQLPTDPRIGVAMVGHAGDGAGEPPDAAGSFELLRAVRVEQQVAVGRRDDNDVGSRHECRTRDPQRRRRTVRRRDVLYLWMLQLARPRRQNSIPADG